MTNSDDKEPNKSDIAKREEEILKFWQENNIFKKSEAKDAPAGEFVFYEGPPTANGRPGIHHLEARAFKDAIPRYKTMRGFRVRRRAGWDTHGLPVELEVEKDLGLKSKKEIEDYGIAKFNKECKKSVWKYVNEWRDFTDRMGYWVDMDSPYITYESSYIESVWQVIAEADKKKLLYKDYKVVPWCPRCGTALSSHELAQGYADIKDLSVFVKFKIADFPGAYFLAWTTTPWTLPGNIALAVGNNIVYVKVKVGEEILVLAKDKLTVLSEPYEIITEHKGSEMVGMSYEPLYPFLKENYEGEDLAKAYKVYAADFVNTEDGTGIVHTAVMYGQDDFELGTKIGLPKYHLVNEDGMFKDETGFLAHKFVKDEATAVEIIKDLARRTLLFRKEKYEHSYPHCWRCKTPLIYYARDSWYIRMSELRDELVRENEKINWEPVYIKEGRFGEWLREVKDWAISRERYWGTPLPVWQSVDKKEVLVVDSLETLRRHVETKGNKYFVMRHGEADHNVAGTATSSPGGGSHLTTKGKKEAAAAASELLAAGGVDIIITSPLARTKETAVAIAGALGLAENSIIEDKRLAEIGFGTYEGRSIDDYVSFLAEAPNPDVVAPVGGESHEDVYLRAARLLFECEEKYASQSILFVTHGAPGKTLYAAATSEGEKYNSISLETGEVRSLPFWPYPHNEKFELDLHRPYIDEINLISESGTNLKRVPEVMDVWLDSGAMPFAQDGGKAKYYPADFIAEAIDQTRGWFYTLHAVGVLMGRGAAYKNVISLGHLLDKEGKKMSKSVGNVLDPWRMIDKYGADVLRFWMYSVNQPGDSKNFDERTVDEVNKKVFNLLQNVMRFYEMFKTGAPAVGPSEQAPIIDRWILARFYELEKTVREKVDNYDLFSATRATREFVADLSQWYIRRSRERFKNGGEDSLAAESTTRFILLELAKLMAPFTPYFAEDLYQKVKSEEDPESVHLASWPTGGEINSQILAVMALARSFSSLALMERSKSGINVRQPLSLLKIKHSFSPPLFWDEIIEIIKDEVNIKDVILEQQPDIAEPEVFLDKEITPELRDEGVLRDLIRDIQDRRKERGLLPDEQIKLTIKTGTAGRKIIDKFETDIMKTVGAESLSVEEVATDNEFGISF